MSKFVSAAKCVLSCLAVALLILLATSNPASAQVQNATITGTATDPSGAAIVGAKIVV